MKSRLLRWLTGAAVVAAYVFVWFVWEVATQGQTPPLHTHINSITYNTADETLMWSTEMYNAEERLVGAERRFIINFQSARMGIVGGSSRGFDTEEATRVGSNMHEVAEFAQMALMRALGAAALAYAKEPLPANIVWEFASYTIRIESVSGMVFSLPKDGTISDKDGVAGAMSPIFQQLLNHISGFVFNYARESVAWWDAGEGLLPMRQA